ncbi:MAG: hypothetical protein KDH09_05080 [Chrysiogenetes bacterium]|nr:hypothetical protein [Chrysiogenetes bacterium]
MIEAIRETLGPWYVYIKFVHVLAVMIWGWSTMVGFGWYLRPMYIKWLRNPGDEVARERRNWAMEHFDRGVVPEHVAFPIVIVTGLLMFMVGDWHLGMNWLTFKLALVFGIFVPMEAVDYYLSHFGGNKEKIKKTGDMERYEKMIRVHWKFFIVTTPLVAIFIPTIIFLAIVKPF